MAEQDGDLTAQEGAEETIATEQERPTWLPEKFADESAFRAAYDAAERRITEQGTELSQIREQMEELVDLMQQPAPQQQFGDPAQNPLVMEYERAFQEGDTARMLAVQAQISQAVFQQEQDARQAQNGDNRNLDPYLISQMRDQIASRYEADEEMQAKAFQIMESDPVVSVRLQQLAEDPNATIGDLAPVVDTAYRLAQAGAVSRENASLAQQQQDQEAARQRKIDAETLSGSGPTRVAPESEQKLAWDRIRNASDNHLIIGER